MKVLGLVVSLIDLYMIPKLITTLVIPKLLTYLMSVFRNWCLLTTPFQIKTNIFNSINYNCILTIIWRDFL